MSGRRPPPPWRRPTGFPVGVSTFGRYRPEAAPPDTIPPPMTTPPSPLPDRTLLLWTYERMGLIRGFEERHKTLVERGVPVGPVHFYTGREAVAVGAGAALRQTGCAAPADPGPGRC